MLFKGKMIELLLLLLVIISFAWIGVHKQTFIAYNETITENMENNTDVPTCSGPDVPTCHENVVSDYDPYSYDSNYILKTKVVPALCPACPSVINNHDHGENLYDGLVDESGKSVINKQISLNHPKLMN